MLLYSIFNEIVFVFSLFKVEYITVKITLHVSKDVSQRKCSLTTINNILGSNIVFTICPLSKQKQ